MTKSEFDFETWFDSLSAMVLDQCGVDFRDEDSVREDYEADACDVICGAHEVDCAPDGRPDKAGAVFIVRRQKPATANFPHDDMGTPV